MTWISMNYQKNNSNILHQIDFDSFPLTEQEVTLMAFFAKCQWHAVHWKLIGIWLRLPFLQSEEEYQCAAAKRNGRGKKRPAGKILQMQLTAAGRLPVSRCREQQSEAEKNKSKQISAFVSVSGVEWRLLAVLKGAADRGSQASGISPRILPYVCFTFTMRHEEQ